MKKPTIYEIKRLTAETQPYFFSRNTLKFFGQTMKDFKVMHHTQNNVKGFLIEARCKDFNGNYTHLTQRFYNPNTCNLDTFKEA